MRRPWLFAALLAALSLILAASAPSAANGGEVRTPAPSGVALEVFTRAGCPRCAAAKTFLERLARENPSIHVVERRVDRDPDALEALEQYARAARIGAPSVPMFVVRGAVVVGFDTAETSGRRIRALVQGEKVTPEAGEACVPEASATCKPESEDIVETRLFGRLSVSSLGMPLFTLAVGLLDGFNPCAMWVLVFLLSMLAGLRSRTRMALIAGTFVVTSGVVYYAFMAAWLNVFLLIGMSRPIEVVLGLVAFVMGALNVKDYVAFKHGPSLTIPEASKPRIYARIRAVLRASGLIGSLASVVVLAVLVNFVELLCTAGFPAVYTAILTKQGLPWWQHYAYLGLYNLAYIADDSLMVGVAVITLSRRRLTERAGRFLKLVSGVVMLGLAAMLLIWPQMLR